MSFAVRWDTDLIRRYDLAGPRYTSYPTAPQFHAGIGPAEFRAALNASRDVARPLSLYVHVPFCSSLCYYCGCNKVVTTDHGKSASYLDHLEKEARTVAAELDRTSQSVEQLHLGGGTPTFLGHAELRRLMDILRRNFRLRDDDQGDYSIEIDPRACDAETMRLLRELGFNRVSLGVQDIDPAVQQAVNRVQPLAMTEAMVAAARANGFRSLNIDLIYGLPLQTEAGFARTVEAIIALRPDRLSLFNYAHLPERFKAQRLIRDTDLPAPAAKLAMLQDSIARLMQAGYRYIGMDHFALPEDSLAQAQEAGGLHRNFQGYTTHAHCDLVGLGVSAISQVGNLYAQNNANLKAWEELVEAQGLATIKGLRAGFDDRLRRAVIQRLICDFRLEFAPLEEDFDISFRSYFSNVLPALQRMDRDGLLQLTEDGIEIRPAGRLLVRSVCMLFDRHLAEQSHRRFSRVI
ncbi:MAG: oxygen-independent coproporphyrinogen oxidase [Moraxellaceae bacterium]|nr:oxygen-independent coproporphyrinogen oxidase [Moraxellaceae bacterium]